LKYVHHVRIQVHRIVICQDVLIVLVVAIVVRTVVSVLRNAVMAVQCLIVIAVRLVKIVKVVLLIVTKFAAVNAKYKYPKTYIYKPFLIIPFIYYFSFFISFYC